MFSVWICHNYKNNSDINSCSSLFMTVKYRSSGIVSASYEMWHDSSVSVVRAEKKCGGWRLGRGGMSWAVRCQVRNQQWNMLLWTRRKIRKDCESTHATFALLNLNSISAIILQEIRVCSVCFNQNKVLLTAGFWT